MTTRIGVRSKRGSWRAGSACFQQRTLRTASDQVGDPSREADWRQDGLAIPSHRAAIPGSHWHGVSSPATRSGVIGPSRVPLWRLIAPRATFVHGIGDFVICVVGRCAAYTIAASGFVADVLHNLLHCDLSVLCIPLVVYTMSSPHFSSHLNCCCYLLCSSR